MVKNKNGQLEVNTKKAAIYLCFHPLNLDSQEYIKMEKCLPHIKGLKRADKRAEFTFNLLKKMEENGIAIKVNN